MISPFGVSFLICKRQVLAQVEAKIPRSVKERHSGLEAGLEPLAPNPWLPCCGPLGAQAGVISLFLGNKAGVVWRGVWRERRVPGGRGPNRPGDDDFPALWGTSKDTEARCVDFAPSLV